MKSFKYIFYSLFCIIGLTAAPALQSAETPNVDAMTAELFESLLSDKNLGWECFVNRFIDIAEQAKKDPNYQVFSKALESLKTVQYSFFIGWELEKHKENLPAPVKQVLKKYMSNHTALELLTLLDERIATKSCPNSGNGVPVRSDWDAYEDVEDDEFF